MWWGSSGVGWGGKELGWGWVRQGEILKGRGGKMAAIWPYLSIEIVFGKMHLGAKRNPYAKF